MKILITGGAGFIGGNFVHFMLNKYPDYDIINLDLLTYAGNLETLKDIQDKPNYKFYKGDIANRKFIFDLFEKEQFDIVVNFLGGGLVSDLRYLFEYLVSEADDGSFQSSHKCLLLLHRIFEKIFSSAFNDFIFI